MTNPTVGLFWSSSPPTPSRPTQSPQWPPPEREILAAERVRLVGAEAAETEARKRVDALDNLNPGARGVGTQWSAPARRQVRNRWVDAAALADAIRDQIADLQHYELELDQLRAANQEKS